jgi:hypothetical protein
MNNRFDAITECPHCKEQAFQPVMLEDKYLKTRLEAHKHTTNLVGTMTIGCKMVEIYFKLCTLCGFMAPFSPSYLKVNR